MPAKPRQQVAQAPVDAVVIGRNEGARLVACLESLAGQVRHVVYVDSGSTDGSIAAARNAGAEVVVLDPAMPFTAARARNAGLAALPVQEDDVLVQLLDGDCTLRAGWIETARAFLEDNPQVAVVCGRRRERHPQASVYNRLCDAEWDTPVGPALACGGDALMRLAPVSAAGGFRDGLIAGEEPELCLRLRSAGWRIWRLDAEMTLHDAAMTRLGQWWRRTRRAGHAYAEGAALHGNGPDRHWVREARRALGWGLVLPVLTLAAGLAHPAGWLLLLIWPAQVIRLAWRSGPQGWRALLERAVWERALFTTFGKLPEAVGVLDFNLKRMTGRRSGLIEYK